MTDYADLFNEAVAAELRAERARQGISFDDLVTRSGVSKSSVQRYLGGDRAIPIPSLVDLCRALNIDPRVVFERAEQSFK